MAAKKQNREMVCRIRVQSGGDMGEGNKVHSAQTHHYKAMVIQALGACKPPGKTSETGMHG